MISLREQDELREAAKMRVMQARREFEEARMVGREYLNKPEPDMEYLQELLANLEEPK